MSFNLRNHIARDGLKRSIEGNFGMQIELITPDGIEITQNEDGETLKAQVLYDRENIDPESGNLIVIKETRVVIRRSALSRVPEEGETWQVKIPINPALQNVLTQFLCNADESPEGGQSSGFITLKLKDVDQSS